MITIKDIEQMQEAGGDVEYYIEEQAEGYTHHIYFKSLEALKKYVKEKYNADLQHKENALKKISGVKIWKR